MGKVPDAGKDWGQKKRASEDEMAGWLHQCNGHKIGQTLGDGEGQGGLVCCSSWGCKVDDWTTHRLTWWLTWLRICLQCRKPGFYPWVGKISEEGNGSPFQYSCLENPMDRGAWKTIVHGITKSQTWLKRLSPHAHTQTWGFHTSLARNWTQSFSLARKYRIRRFFKLQYTKIGKSFKTNIYV